MKNTEIKKFGFILGIVLLVSGMLIVVVTKGSVFFLEAYIMIALGFVLPFLSFMENNNCEPYNEKTKKLSIKTYLIIAFLIQIFLAPFFYDMFNFQQWLSAADMFAQGINPYQFCYESSRFDLFPYPSTFLYLMVIGREIFQAFGQTALMIFFKSLLIISNVVTAYLIYKIIIALNDDHTLAKKATCLFIFNPLLVFVTSVQGEFDPLVILFTVLATYLFVVKKSLVLSSLSLGIGFSLKLYPLLLLPFFLIYIKNLKKRAAFILLVMAPILIVSIPFLILNYQAYINVAFNTGGGPGPFSPWQSGLIEAFSEPFFRLFFTLSLFGVLIVTLLLLHNRKLVTDIFFCLIAVYITFPFIHENHITWVLPFAVLRTKNVRLIQIATLLPFIHMLLLTGISSMSGLPYWLSSLIGHEKALIYSLYANIGAESSLVLSGILVTPFLAVCIYILAKYIYAMFTTN